MIMVLGHAWREEAALLSGVERQGRLFVGLAEASINICWLQCCSWLISSLVLFYVWLLQRRIDAKQNLHRRHSFETVVLYSVSNVD